ncbi:MAG: DUF116 domain-containing protein [Firmicutes bacterium]|nr:DUF116 domain-containing protein [Bacillota bacterium]
MSVPTYSLTPQIKLEESYYSSVEGLASEAAVRSAEIFYPITHSLGVVCTEQACLELLLLGIYARRGLAAGQMATLDHLAKNLERLERSKDYAYQTKKLRLWHRFIMQQCSANRALILRLISCATDWFAKRSREVLGVYTAQVSRFLAGFDASGRSDILLCTSPVLEYHINMVGAEMLNKLWQSSFAKTKQQLAVVPGCLRPEPGACTAKEWILGFKCSRCSEGCQISRLSGLGERYGFQVSFVKHQSSLVSHVQSLERLAQKRSMGILGVACVLSLLEGGLMLKAHKVAAQCVPLDFSGCKNHWHAQGLPGSVSMERVLKIMLRARNQNERSVDTVQASSLSHSGLMQAEQLEKC